MNLYLKNNSLFNGENIIKKFEVTVDKFLLIDNKIVVLIRNIIVNNNVECFNIEGERVWTIHTEVYPQKSCIVTNIYVRNERLYVYRYCGIEEEINIKDGTIIQSELIK